MNHPKRAALAIVSVLNVTTLLTCCSSLNAETTIQLPPGVALEEPCSDPALTKIVLIAGSNFFKPGEHAYVGGCAVLADLLRETPGVFPVLALDWPKKADTFSGAKSVVFFFDGGDKHAVMDDGHRAEVQKMIDAGVGLVCFHQCIDVPLHLGPQMREWTGAAFEKGFSQRAHWVAEFNDFPSHPICQGVAPFRIDDGWLYKLRFVDSLQGVTPLLRTAPPTAKAAPKTDSETIVAWAYERPRGGRSFTFTGCHLHRSLAEEGYRRFLVNGILWTAGRDVPASGARVAFDAAQLDHYLSAPPSSAKK